MYFRPTPTAKSKALRHLPNPPSPKPRLPLVGHLHLLDPLIHHSLIRLSKRYGPIFSLYFGSMPTVVASSPELFKLFLQTHEATSFNTRFQTSAIRRLTYDNSVAMVPFGPYWKFIRKLIMNDLLNATTVAKLRPLRSQEIKKVLKVLAQNAEAQTPVDVTEELLKWTNSTISKMMLGEAEEIRHIARELLKIFGEYSLSDFIWPLKKLKVGQYEKRIDNILGMYDPVVERDFFSAGTDSTAVATDWALAELINNPRVLAKAREEVYNVVGKDRLVEETDIQNLPYIRAIVKETFRMHPPLPVVKRKCVAECEVDGYVIPEGALILFNVWAVQRDPKYWESPLEFKPERFLENPAEAGEAGAIDLRGQHFTLLPFGSGRRMCPGVNLATAGMASLLASLIQNFDLQVVGPTGKPLKGKDNRASMEERPGLTVPRAHNLVCVPVAKSTATTKLLSS
ncbi:hypothetical protein Ahy_A03g011501 [Arachis hypogaea]|uniref:Isoflavone synthase n=1 Tax=Arachis hypogaea TaxID=3818 RepID=A0A445DQV2_ARAHY|nr:hypothetical protein Ahy_A03g011501 [Arachis hypogaea]